MPIIAVFIAIVIIAILFLQFNQFALAYTVLTGRDGVDGEIASVHVEVNPPRIVEIADVGHAQFDVDRNHAELFQDPLVVCIPFRHDTLRPAEIHRAGNRPCL